ncbi:olfactory receptor 10K2-like [Tachyglossus aculeatus]|uniref:olfactory receptor 10K2-like n=1 Tax=Tachyglossus aculeatus TaxID=9261 RepID=UPI0018F3B3F4|nr:olfactory receptor 10K2-like [Tachyglossus aculeatus]
MFRENHTTMSEFILLGFSHLGGSQRPLFGLFLLLYLVTLGANAVIVTTIVLDRHLHVPMYFFLGILSCSETLYTLVIIPKALVDLLARHRAITITACAFQMGCFLFLGCSHSFLLAAMGFDRYVAICRPLSYMGLMTRGVCMALVVAASFCGSAVSLVVTSLIFGSSVPSSGHLQHFFCDIPPVLRVTLPPGSPRQGVILALCALVLVIPLFLIVASYACIVAAILRIPSSGGRVKPFSTCASHLIVVTIHYACASFIYLRPGARDSSGRDTLVSVTYTVVTPLLNPVIYSLRNREFRVALYRVFERLCCPVLC